MKFGITQETKTKNAVPIEAPKKGPNGQWVFPQVLLTEVKCHTVQVEEKGDVDVFDMKFIDVSREREHTERWFVADPDDPKYDEAKTAQRLEWFSAQMAHLIVQYTSIPKEGIGANATTIKEYYKAIADFINTGKSYQEEGSEEVVKYPIFYTSSKRDKIIPVWLKLTYYQNRLKIPTWPNFIERATPNSSPKTLTVDISRDELEPKKKTPTASPLGGIVAGSDEFPSTFTTETNNTPF